MIYVPLAIFWMLFGWAMFSKRPVVLYLFFASIPVGAFATIPTNLTAGVTLTATPMISALLIGKVFLDRKGPDFLLTSALRPGRMLLLFLFWVVAVVTTMFMPRIFMGDIRIVPIRGDLGETMALFPTPQNITQVVYMTISVLTVFAFARILQSRDDRQHALKALVLGGAVAVFTGLLDFATQFAPIEPLLTPWRTASYALATNVEVFGSKRVVGLMPEASAFGGVALAMLCALIFLRRVIQSARVRNFYAPIVIGGLVLCVWLAKSSGAYLGLAVLVLLILSEAMFRAFSRGGQRKLHRQDLVGEFMLVLGIVVVAGIFVILQPTIMDPIYAIVDRMVLSKTESGSFEERGFWRATAIEALFASHGLGVGLGGTRSSSSVVAIFAGTGFLGGLLFYGFVLQTLLRRSRHMDWEGQFVISAVRFAFIPPFVVSMMVGGANFGPMNAFFLGIVTATVISRSNLARRRQARRSRHAMRPYPGMERPALALSNGQQLSADGAGGPAPGAA